SAPACQHSGQTWDVCLTVPKELAIHRSYPKSQDRVRQVVIKLLQLAKGAVRCGAPVRCRKVPRRVREYRTAFGPRRKAPCLNSPSSEPANAGGLRGDNARSGRL